MNTKRMMRWVIVLFLLAMLPVVTAVMAQGEEPVKQLPAVTEMGESATTIPWVNSESNPNNSIADVTWFPELLDDFEWGGTINAAGDVDYWAITWDLYKNCEDCPEENSLPILIDIEAQSIGSPVNSYICLYSDDFIELSCNNDTDTLDSMLFYNIEIGRTYYLRVSNWNGTGGSAYKYQVLVSAPLLISAAASGLGTGNVAGIPFQSGDILAWNDFNWGTYPNAQHEEKWVMLFDLSDLNVKGNVTNLAAGWRNSDFLLLGFAANATLPGITGSVTPWEVVTFNPTQIGPFTQGTFQRWWNGKNQGLTLAAEKVDAIDWPVWNGNTRLRVSTTGAAVVPTSPSGNVRLRDEDVGLWDISNGKWILSFDGSIVDWGIGGEDIIAMSYGEILVRHSEEVYVVSHSYYLVLQGTATLDDYFGGPFNVNQKDIVNFAWCDSPCASQLIYLFWRGPAHGWNYNIDAIDYWNGDLSGEGDRY